MCIYLDILEYRVRQSDLIVKTDLHPVLAHPLSYRRPSPRLVFKRSSTNSARASVIPGSSTPIQCCVYTLCIDGSMMKIVVSEALESVALDWERAAEVLPVLDIIEVRGKWPAPEIMSTFIDARLEMGHPVELEWVNI